MSTLDSHKYKDVICCTAVYFGMYYIFLYGQSGVAHYVFRKAKAENAKKNDEKTKSVSFASVKYGSNDKLSLTAARSVGNTMEQMVPFLASLWMNAVFVDPTKAAKLGWIYIITRSYYPIAFYFGLPWILLSTLPGYGVIFQLLREVVQAAF